MQGSAEGGIYNTVITLDIKLTHENCLLCLPELFRGFCTLSNFDLSLNLIYGFFTCELHFDKTFWQWIRSALME